MLRTKPLWIFLTLLLLVVVGVVWIWGWRKGAGGESSVAGGKGASGPGFNLRITNVVSFSGSDLSERFGVVVTNAPNGAGARTNGLAYR